MLKIIPAIYKEGRLDLLESPPEGSSERVMVVFEVSEKKKTKKPRKPKVRLSEMEACGMWAGRTDWPDHPAYRHLRQMSEEKKDGGSSTDR